MLLRKSLNPETKIDLRRNKLFSKNKPLGNEISTFKGKYDTNFC